MFFSWLRRVLFGRPRVDLPTDEQLATTPEKRFAIFVPLWREAGVIGRMLAHNIASIRYRNYEFFVGAYPNDDETLAAVREAENRHLLKQSGADSVVVSSETAGRLLGIATTTPSVVEMMEDLLTPQEGFAIAEREVERKEVGGSPRHLSDIVLGVLRSGELLRVDSPDVDALEQGDRLLYVRSVER